jgi:hypothetical protein
LDFSLFDSIIERYGQFKFPGKFGSKTEPELAEGVISAPFLLSGDQGRKGGFAPLPKQHPIARRIIDETP